MYMYMYMYMFVKMKNKKLKINGIFIVALIFLIGLIFFVIFLSCEKKQFNPEEDVCLDEYNRPCKYVEPCSFNEGEYTCWGEWEGYGRSGYNCNQNFRPKTKCQLDPEAEGCICDGYEEKEMEIYTNEFEKQLITSWSFDSDKIASITVPIGQFRYVDCSSKIMSDCGNYHCKNINLTTCNAYNDVQKIDTILLYTDNCIKSHEANECELENPDYVLDYDNCPLTFKFNKSETIDVTCGKPSCRKKTIYDYSCEELEGQYMYCPKDNKFDSFCWCLDCDIKVEEARPECFEKEESEICSTLKDIAIEKGCEI